MSRFSASFSYSSLSHFLRKSRFFAYKNRRTQEFIIQLPKKESSRIQKTGSYRITFVRYEWPTGHSVQFPSFLTWKRPYTGNIHIGQLNFHYAKPADKGIQKSLKWFRQYSTIRKSHYSPLPLKHTLMTAVHLMKTFKTIFFSWKSVERHDLFLKEINRSHMDQEIGIA